MIGDAQVGKTSLMVKYVENNFNEDHIQTLGVNFLQKHVELQHGAVTFSVWDLGGQQEYLHMLPLACSDAVALLFMFDLTRRATLTSIKTWYRQARLLNKTAVPVLVATKYDLYVKLPEEQQRDMAKQARLFAGAMQAPLVFVSARESINIHSLFKIVLARVFNLECTLARIKKPGEPILEF
jgi:GTP-binding protein of the ras superfamily involved in termination of M-phase